MQTWWPFATRSRVELQFLPTPGRKRSTQLHKMYQNRFTAKNSWWWAERLNETCRGVIPIKLEFSASVGFIHKESVTTHGHAILKNWFTCMYLPRIILVLHNVMFMHRRDTWIKWSTCETEGCLFLCVHVLSSPFSIFRTLTQTALGCSKLKDTYTV